MFGRASWTLLDQAVVSLGAFLLNIALARHLAPAEYGIFALIVGVLLLLQLVVSSVILYPMSVRVTVLPEEARAPLTGGSLLLLALLIAALLPLLALGLLAMGRAELIGPVLLYLAVWQGQEGLRRVLFAGFRHREALAGDMIAYLGPPLIALALLRQGPVALADVFLGMAAAAAVALLVNCRLVEIRFPPLPTLRPTLRDCWRDYWSLGGWSLASNLVAASRIQLFLWGLSALFGVAATAAFQAALNVVNLANPILLGLCNVIPQAAARKARDGHGAAWKAARAYATIGALPLLPCYGALLVAPELVLRLLYGSGSAYLELALPIRILVVGYLLSYAADMICSFLHGVDAARLALVVSTAGTLAAAALFLPLAQHYGLAGACAALSASNLARLIAARWFLTRMIAHGRPSVA